MPTSEPDLHVRHLVVGAGVTGLAYADWLATGDVLVVEKDDAIGGYCKTVAQDGFVWDYSGHFFHFKHPEIERYLVERMSDQKVLRVDKRSFIDFEGHRVDFPFQKNIHQLPKDDFIACLVDLFFKDEGRDPDAAPANFQDMLYAKFGRGIAERFLIPYNEKLYATDLSQLDVDAMGRFFPYANLEQIVGNMRQADNASYNAHFTYPEGGAIQYVNALAQGVSDTQLALGERVERIDLAAKVVHTRSSEGARTIGFDVLVSSAPFPVLLRMAGVPFAADTFSYNKVLVFNLGFDRKGPDDVHWMYYPSRDVSFYRVGFYDNIFGTDRMSIYVELGYPSDAVVDDAVIAARRADVLRDLARVGLVDGHELVSEHHIVLDPAYVHITQRSNAEVERLKGVLEARGVHSLGRYGSWTYCAIEDNIVEARGLAERYNALGELGA